MPTKPKHACLKPGCPNLVASGNSYCPEHKASRTNDYEKKRLSPSKRGYDARWYKYSAKYRKDHPLCVNYPECHKETDVVDHIVPVNQGGDFWDPGNHQPMCKPCHDRKTAQESGGFKNKKRGFNFISTVNVTVVCGPPGSGKSSYVTSRMKWGDLVIDMDVLYHAISMLPKYEKPDVLLPFVCEARDAAINRLCRPNDIRTAWIITSGAKRSDRERFKDSRNKRVRVVVMETSPNECMKRINQDTARSGKAQVWRGLIESWWKAYESSDDDIVVRG